MIIRLSFVFVCALFTLALAGAAGTAHAACSSPAGDEGELEWDTAQKQFKYCDGTNWNFLEPGSGGGGVTAVCRMSSSSVNGLIGPTGCAGGITPRWNECALMSCDRIADSNGAIYDCDGPNLHNVGFIFHSIQYWCSDGSCDPDYRIFDGIFLCTDF